MELHYSKHETNLLRKPNSRSPLVLQPLRDDNGRPVGLYQDEGRGSAARGAQPRMHPRPAMDGDELACRVAGAGGRAGIRGECMVAAGRAVGVLPVVRGGISRAALPPAGRAKGLPGRLLRAGSVWTRDGRGL